MSRTSEFFRGLAGSLFKSLTRSGSKPSDGRPAGGKGKVSTPLDQRAGAADQRGAAGQRGGAAGQRAGKGSSPARPGTGGVSTPRNQQAGAAAAAGAEVGRYGSTATVEINPAQVGKVAMTYSPSVDGNPDPGEVVWTWVPFEENDGRGKDRPVLVVANLTNGSVLAVQLTSKAHDGDREFLSLGAGSWDAENRPSWVNLDRVFRVHPDGMRREAASLDKARFDRVKTALTSRYSWR